MAQGDQFFLASATGDRLELSGEVSVGRSAECDLVVSEGQPSRQHAKIVVEAGGVFVEDLGSTNGTLVNGAPIQSSPLQPGDRIRIGDVEMVFEP